LSASTRSRHRSVGDHVRPVELALVAALLASGLVLAPLFRSGMPALVVLALELLAVVLLVIVLWRPRPGLYDRLHGLALLLLFAIPVLYIVPLPAWLIAWLPGREAYLEAQRLASAEPLNTVSLFPLESWSAWVFMLVPIGVFLGARLLDVRHTMGLVHLLLGLASAQALLGLLQYVASPGSPQLLGMDLPDLRSAVGTYTNRNHLAGFLEMALPVGLALMAYSVGQRGGPSSEGWRGRVLALGSFRGHLALAYGVLALVILVGLVYTRSRAGIGLSVLGILVSTAMFARRLGGNNVYGATGTLVASALGVGIAIGLAQVLDRFSVAGAVQDGRWTIFSSTLEGIGAFAPLGSGPGNYPDVFVAFQPLKLGEWFINHAHNDYLEWLFEGGLIAGGLLIFLLVLFVGQWIKVVGAGTWTRFRFVQIGAGIGITLLALHSLVDFNLHIPANVVYFAFLSAVFFSDPTAGAEQPRRERQRRTLTLDDAREGAMPAAPVAQPTLPPDQIPNPFLDEPPVQQRDPQQPET
jgi:O-antigen ligase